MINVRNFFIPLAALIALVMGGCHHDSATMSELARIDSMVYHQHEKEALPLLLQMKTDQLSKQERAYHTVLLSMAMYKNYVPCTSDSAINEAVSYYRNKGDDLKYLKALVATCCQWRKGNYREKMSSKGRFL